MASAVALNPVVHRVETRLEPPPRRRGLAPRTRLVDRLLDACELPLALIVAPAGYGKTTVLSEWAERDIRPFAWLRLDEQDDHPVALRASIDSAMRYFHRRDHPIVLVLDDVDRIRNAEAFEVIGEVAEAMPPGSQLALSSRSDPGLAVGRLRAHRSVVELRAADLAMTPLEASVLLRAAGLRLPPDLLETLVRRTEGWAAGLYLAALSLREQSDVRGGVSRFGGDDRLVAEYLRDEFLLPLGAERASFLIRTSVLETLSGPSCDAVLETSGSGRTLAELARENGLLVGVGRTGDSYRHHRLFAEMLRGELHRLEPGRERHLHALAGAWHGSQGSDGLAIRHAVAAGDIEAAGRVLWGCAGAQIANGRNDTVAGRLKEFAPGQIAACAPLALVAAESSLAAGDGADAKRWATAAARSLGTASSKEEADSLRAGVTVVRAMVAGGSLAAMRRNGSRVRELPACNLLEGVARHLKGDREGARDPLEEGGLGEAVSAPEIQALCLAQLALLMVDAGRWDSAATVASRARSQLQIGDLRSYPVQALVFAASSLVRGHRGMTSEAAGDIREATALLARLSSFAPWYEAETRIVLARAALRLSDLAGARRLVGEAERFMRDVPDSPVLREWLGDCKRQLRAAASSAEESWTLTASELRVLRLLPTHLSFPAIAKSLYVSPNTVKTHVRAVYRKLHASSRAEAVALACDAGLLDTQS